MKIKLLSAKDIKAVSAQVLIAIKAELDKSPEYYENTEKWFIDRCGYIIDAAKTKKVDSRLSSDIEARINTINGSLSQKATQQSAGKEFDDLEEMTTDGLSELLAEHIILVNIERPIIGREIDEARAQGDLSENAEYDAAREKQGQLEQKIAEIKATMDEVQIIDAKKVNTDIVGVGTKVSYKKGNKTLTFIIKGSTQADPAQGIISRESAVAKAILGKTVGDKIKIRTRNPYDIKIIKIEKGL